MYSILSLRGCAKLTLDEVVSNDNGILESIWHFDRAGSCQEVYKVTVRTVYALWREPERQVKKEAQAVASGGDSTALGTRLSVVPELAVDEIERTTLDTLLTHSRLSRMSQATAGRWAALAQCVLSKLTQHEFYVTALNVPGRPLHLWIRHTIAAPTWIYSSDTPLTVHLPRSFSSVVRTLILLVSVVSTIL